MSRITNSSKQSFIKHLIIAWNLIFWERFVCYEIFGLLFTQERMKGILKTLWVDEMRLWFQLWSVVFTMVMFSWHQTNRWIVTSRNCTKVPSPVYVTWFSYFPFYWLKCLGKYSKGKGVLFDYAFSLVVTRAKALVFLVYKFR